ncbi:DNA-binding transcriptional LysR family regulator [Mumia flava]|uniref:DNA-binding transcriptional LysR family regulator n=1 Tax=Mumia flava TaxID=1348852 RepID=A0A0B2BT69_9ACTN|nr:LysR family transcriptional regulator [Mumia flava]PJJ57219.1 DNA-binding transcriptional LysR family regulator [Mumia flava]
MTEAWPDLEDLALLVGVAEAGSIGRAAELRGMTQPSVSRRMAALERRLGVALLVRTPRGTTLTAGGRTVVEWADRLLGAADDFRASVRGLRAGRTAAVRAAVSMTIAECYASAWLARLYEREPDLFVSLEVHNSADVGAIVAAGDADIGFVESPTVRSDLRKRRVGIDRLAVAVAPGHRWSGTDASVRPGDLADGGVLVREQGSGTRDTLEAALAAVGEDLRPGLVLGSNTALASSAATGIGPVVLSERALAADLESGRLIEVRVDGMDLTRPLTAVWRDGEALTPGAEALLSAVAG